MDAAVELMRRDVDPAEVLMPDGALLSGVRAFVTSHRLIVYAVGSDPEKPFDRIVDLLLVDPFSVEASHATLPANGRLECRVYTEFEEDDSIGTAWVNRGAGCGCKSRLKALGTPCEWSSK